MSVSRMQGRGYRMLIRERPYPLRDHRLCSRCPCTPVWKIPFIFIDLRAQGKNNVVLTFLPLSAEGRDPRRLGP